jgi:HAD superfamily hydrolase (TIGR01509 family)
MGTTMREDASADGGDGRDDGHGSAHRQRVIDVVCFDLMDTVIRDPYREALRAGAGMPLRSLGPLRDPTVWPAFERGEIDEAELARRYFVEGSGARLDMVAFHRERRAGYAFLPGMREMLIALEGRVRRVAASNYPRWIDELSRDFAFDVLFDVRVVSCDVGVRKPDPAFYEKVIEASRAPAERCLFVDDRPENCAAAERHGMRAHAFVDAATLRLELARVGVLVA